MTLNEVAAATGLARPTARRMLLTLEELGYIRTTQGAFALTPRVLEPGMAYIGSTSIWDIARPLMDSSWNTLMNHHRLLNSTDRI
jgi:IclR family pca regulon transcriptional regulator